MIELVISPGMKKKTLTRSWNMDYRNTHRNFKDVESQSVMKPIKDGWYPLNILTSDIYD